MSAAEPPTAGPLRPLHLQPAALTAVAVGGAAGTAARYGLETAFPVGSGWPAATFGINLGGAFILGFLATVLAATDAESSRRRLIRLCAGTGCCGAFTTYSTFALEQTNLWRAGSPGLAIAYGAVSVLGGVGTAALGLAGGRLVIGWTGPAR